MSKLSSNPKGSHVKQWDYTPPDAQAAVPELLVDGGKSPGDYNDNGHCERAAERAVVPDGLANTGDFVQDWRHEPASDREEVPLEISPIRSEFDSGIGVRGTLIPGDQLERREALLKALLMAEFGASADRATQLCAQISNELSADCALKLPEVAPRLYANRPDKSQKADDFLREVWRDWLGNGLYKNILRKLDEPLVQALNNQYRGRSEDLTKLLPTKWEAVTVRLEAIAGSGIPKEKRRVIASLERGLRSAIAKT